MTTVVIDTENFKIVSDSRGTVTTKEIQIGKFFLPRRVVNKDYLDNTKKIFKIGSNYVTGSGSLCMIKEIVNRFEKGLTYTPNKFTVKRDYLPSITKVVICKEFNGECKNIILVLKPKHIPFTKYYTVYVEKKKETAQHLVLGSGRDLARKALDAGASPEEAVTIAMENDEYSGGRLDVHDIRRKT